MKTHSAQGSSARITPPASLGNLTCSLSWEGSQPRLKGSPLLSLLVHLPSHKCSGTLVVCCCCCCLVPKSCPTLLRPHGLTSVHGVFQARTRKQVAFSFSSGLNTHLLLCRQILYHWATWEAPPLWLTRSRSSLAVQALIVPVSRFQMQRTKN